MRGFKVKMRARVRRNSGDYSIADLSSYVIDDIFIFPPIVLCSKIFLQCLIFKP